MSSATSIEVPAASGRLVPFGLWILRTVVLWIALMVSAAVAAKVCGHLSPVPPIGGPLTVMQALLVVNGGIAIVLSLLAARSRARGVELALLLFAAYYCLCVGMMAIEAVFFNESLKEPMDQILSWGEQGLIIGAITGFAGALMYHPAEEEAAPVPGNIFWRVVWLSLIYVFLYFFAGFFIAWQSAAVRAFYSTMHMEFVPLLALQVFRGFLWALISLFIVTRIRGSLFSRALIMGALFAVVTAIQLLYPNAIMPEAVRMAHLAEIGSSEFVYGFVAAYILLGRGARKPLSGTSPWRLIAGRA